MRNDEICWSYPDCGKKRIVGRADCTQECHLFISTKRLVVS